MSGHKVSIPRIGRVRMKSGADVSVLRQRSEFLRDMSKWVERAGSALGGEISGGVVIVWDGDGRWLAWRNDPDAAIGTNMMPDFVRTALIREACEDDTRNLLD